MTSYGLNIHQVHDSIIRIDWAPVKKSLLLLSILVGVVIGGMLLYAEMFLQAIIFTVLYGLLGIFLYKAIYPMSIDIHKHSSSIKIVFTNIYGKTTEKELSLPVTIRTHKKLFKAPNIVVAPDFICSLNSQSDSVELWMDTFWKAQGALIPRAVFEQQDVDTLSQLLDIPVEK